jgi:ferredoxin-NADP reductase
MFAKELKCTVLSIDWMTSTVFKVRFRPEKNFEFEPGQFISLLVPEPGEKNKFMKRCYSLANSPERAKLEGYELCIKHVPQGKGTSYLASLTPGDSFRCLAPFGDFQYRNPKSGERLACFIATGTGLAPIRSILESQKFKANAPQHTILIFGAKSETEILYRGELEKLGVSPLRTTSASKAALRTCFAAFPGTGRGMARTSTSAETRRWFET